MIEQLVNPEHAPPRAGGPPHVWSILLGMVAAVALLGVAACDSDSTTSARDPRVSQRYSPNDLTTQQRHGGSHYGGTATGDTRDGAAFARWVLEQDPQQRYITDAVVRNEQTLGIKVQSTITKAELHQLLTSLAEGMARTFPGKSLTVVAFYQSGDKLAEAVYNVRSRRIDVRFV